LKIFDISGSNKIKIIKAGKLATAVAMSAKNEIKKLGPP
jgi:hypothetical protein